MLSNVEGARLVRLGLDVHPDTNAAGIVQPRSDAVVVERLFHGELFGATVHRRVFQPRQLWACYETPDRPGMGWRGCRRR